MASPTRIRVGPLGNSHEWADERIWFKDWTSAEGGQAHKPVPAGCDVPRVAFVQVRLGGARDGLV